MVSAGACAMCNLVTETNPQSTSSTTFVDLPGASTTIVVPRRTRALVLARFTGAAQCDGGVLATACSRRRVMGAGEVGPSAGLDFAFDSDSAGGGDGAEGHAAER